MITPDCEGHPDTLTAVNNEGYVCNEQADESGEGYFSVDDCQLILTPLSEITDEDAIEVARMLGVYSENDTPELRKSVILVRFPRHFDAHLQVIDYLRSKSYHLPYQGQDLFESGIAIKAK